MKFQLLPDRPLDAETREENVKFGHGELADTVFELIQEATPPFTIGLYGRWGVGKTTIVNLVEKQARKVGIRTFFFDVWKYERDSLRRQFLIELDRNLGLGLDFKNVLNQSLAIEDPTRIPPIFDWRLIANRIGFLFLLLFAAGIVAKAIGIAQGVSDYIDLYADLSASVGIAGLIIQAGANAIIRINTTITTHRTDSAEGFEDRFKEALAKVKEQKLLITIDNLDRIEDKKMTEVLSDIKTFLSKDNDTKSKVVFLIPCDNSALRTQLISTYGNDFDADEFLRKFFNLTFEIPKFINLDLLEYTQSLLRETGIPHFFNDPNLESVIIYAFRENPREIKQFVNSLISSYLLAEKRKLQIVLDNLAFLAKLLVIRQKFNPIYKVIQEKALRSAVTLEFHDVHNEIRSGLEDQGEINDKYIRDLFSQFDEFNKMTEGINRPELELFLSLRQSDNEKKVPDSDKLLFAFEENREADAIPILQSIIEAGNETALDEVLRDRIRRRHADIAFQNTVITGVNSLYKCKAAMPSFFNEIAIYFPSFNTEQAELLRPEVFFDFYYDNLNLRQRNRPRSQILHALGTTTGDNKPAYSQEYVVELLQQIINHENEFTEQEKNLLRDALKRHFFTLPYISLFIDRRLQDKYLMEETKEQFIQSISSTSPEIRNLFEVLSKLVLNQEQIIEVLEKIVNFLDVELTNPNGTKEELISGITTFSVTQNVQVLPDSAKAFIENLSNRLMQLFDKEVDDGKIKLYFRRDAYYTLLKVLIDIPYNECKGNLIEKIGYFITQAPIEFLREKEKGYFEYAIALTPESFTNRGITHPRLFLEKELFILLPDQQKQEIIWGLIDQGASETPAVIKALEFKLPNNTETINRMIRKLKGVVEGELLDWLNTLKNLGVGDSSSYNQELFQVFLDIRNESDQATTDIALRFVEANKGLFSSGQLNDLGITDKGRNTDMPTIQA